jgi:hypothetical protein
VCAHIHIHIHIHIQQLEPPPAPEDPKETLSKKIRNLKKKIKQTDELQEKVKTGEVFCNIR